MQHWLARNWTFLTLCTVLSGTLVSNTCPTDKPQWQIKFKALPCSKQTATTSLVMSDSEDAVLCHSDVCSAPGGHSTGFRTFWVCLQNHATVVTSNGATICGCKFPPNVSKHWQLHQSALPQTIKAIRHTNNPICRDIEGSASLVHRHCILCL